MYGNANNNRLFLLFRICNSLSGFSIPKTRKEIVGHFNRFYDLLQLDSHFLKTSLNGQCFPESLCCQRRTFQEYVIQIHGIPCRCSFVVESKFVCD